jgi:hypothetical protein
MNTPRLARVALLPAALLLLGMQAVPAGPAGAPPAQRAPSPPAVQATERPSVVIEPPLVDFGVVAPGTKHPAKFVLRNTGSKPLQVEQALPSCKCTDITPIAGKVIPPGGTLELAAALSVPRSPGEKDAKVMISFAGFRGMVEAKMRGEVTLPIRVDPAYLDALKGVTAGTLALSSVDGRPFRVVSAGGKPPMLAAGDSGAAAPQHTLAWTVAGIPGEQLPQWWMIETDREDCPLIPIRIRHEMTGGRFDTARYQRFWFVPESVLVGGRVKQGTPVELATTIEHNNPAAQGRVTNPAWADVKAVHVPGGQGRAELVSATRRGEDFVDVVIRFTPGPGLRGAQYIPIEIETATGRGPAFVAVVVEP